MEEFKKGFYFGLGFITSNLFITLIVGSIIKYPYTIYLIFINYFSLPNILDIQIAINNFLYR